MSDGHLFLDARGGVDYARGLRVWHDEAHNSLLVLSPRSQALRQVSLGSVTASNADTNAHESVLFHFDGSRAAAAPPPVELARLSVDGQFVALQTSDIEVQVVRLATGEAFWILCKSSGGNRILSGGVLWSTHAVGTSRSQDLFFVTRRGLEHYRVSPKRRDCRLHRTISVQVHAFWYSPTHGVLLLASGSRGTELVPYQLRGPSVDKLPRLVFSAPVRQQDVFLASMYGALYAVYCDVRSSKLLLYLVNRARVSCVRSLHLLLPPGTVLQFSVVDNLLVCHSLDFNVSLFFDVRCDGSVHDPFSAPLPVSLLPPGHHSEATNHAPLVISDSLKRDQTDGHCGDEGATPDSDGSDRGDENDDANAFDRQVRAIRRATSVGDLDALSLTDEAVDAGLVPPAPASNPTPLLPRSMTVDESTLKHSEHHAKRQQLEQSTDQSSLSRWQFLSPDLVQRSALAKTATDTKATEVVQLRTLRVNLREICRSAAHHREIIPFLLRRGDAQLAKKLVLELVRDHIVEQIPRLSTISTLLSFVQTLTPSDVNKATTGRGHSGDASSEDEDEDGRTHSSAPSSSNSVDHSGVSGNGTPTEVLRGVSSPSTVKSARADEPDARARLLPARNAQGFVHIFQSDLFRHVWYPLLQDSTFAKTGKLSIYISEYVKNLRQNTVPVESITYVALAQAFIEAGEPQKLYQYLHYHVLSDSRGLADALVRHGAEFPSLMQVGLDMYFRLGAINGLVYTLLEVGETDRAIAISWRNMSMEEHNASAIPAAVFFDACVRSITSETGAVTRLHVSQKLHNLLLFLQVWDPKSLQQSHESCPSRLAQTAQVPFPDPLVTDHFRDRFRSAFGFVVDKREQFV